MLRTILVPVDGSTLAQRAIPFAARLARSTKARLVLVRAHLPDGDSLSIRLHHPDQLPSERAGVERGMAEAELIDTTRELQQAGLEVQSRFVEGPAAESIIEIAASTSADLIVMSTHGHGGLGRMLYGSVADEVLRRSSIPVLTVPVNSKFSLSEDQPQRMVVPLDGSLLSREILGPATELASALKAEMVLVSVVEPLLVGSAYGDMLVPPDLDAELADAEHRLADIAVELRSSTMKPVKVRVAYGKAADAVDDIARELNASLIAMATHGRGGLERFVMGSVATGVLHRSSVPVLLFRPSGVHADAAESSAALTSASTSGA